MPSTRLGWARLGAVPALAALTLGVGLGRAGRLTYHEAFVAQAAREMLVSGGPVTPTVGGRPWLEKPPLAIWLVALAGRLVGGVGEAVARAPSAAAGALLAVAVSLFAARRFGPRVGLLAGLVQVTTAWTVMRGRLAEADMLLACLVAWTLLAFDHVRDARAGAVPVAPEPAPSPAPSPAPGPRGVSARVRAFRDAWHPADLWRWAFFAGLGLTSLAKGVGFGAALVMSAVALVVLWDRDARVVRRLRYVPGWVLTAGISLAWPLAAALRHPSAVRLWALHVTDRLATHPEHFSGQTGLPYVLGLATNLLPWLPLALVGAWRSLPPAFARRGRGGGDRLLLAWTAGPLALLTLATVRNAHYAIHALPPCSVWAALSLGRLGERLRSRGWSPRRVRVSIYGAFAALGFAYALGFAWLGPRLDRRGVEWAFYESAARQLRPGETVSLLYHVPEWDREPYQTPFGPFPHDYAVRLFYLDRAASCRFASEALATEAAAAEHTGSFAVIGRESDLADLGRFGRVETLARGPDLRSDRTYRLFRVTPALPTPIASRNPETLSR